MFWGLIMEPNKRYAQVVEKPFHISQAAIDISTGDNDACQVMVVVDGKNFLICTLQKNKCIQVPLDLYFKTGDSVAFLTNGKCNVHLTGYLDPEFEEEASDEEEEEEEDEEEVPALVNTKNKRKLENSNEVQVSKKVKQDKKVAKKVAKADSSDSDSDDEDQLQKFLEGEDIDTDENDESFKVNTSGEVSDSDEEDDDEEAEEEEEEDDEDDDNKMETSGEAETTLDTSKEENGVDISKLTKSQRRRLKKKQKLAGQQPQVNGIDKSKKQEAPQKAEKKKQEAKKVNQEEAGEKKEKKSLSGGVFVEDTKVGNGPPAKPGKVVMVYYEGRLKQNNKMFDNCLKGPGFKFKLGAKEVIAGWDVGITGMKVGGKRRIVCPPAMAYGAKGSPPVIPPNSTLVFDVELKNVK
ncbi:46 kDa FK506-binding nuclear protein [Achroia grisella]|uniref:46 kDa FK506-binding nuclear protein n=1 Tax=Achroia grisella TaxID=688607 RepID=UPI0027D343A3|nr:46 kDa FK506-binding nuclear protein [Achroia grisella]